MKKLLASLTLLATVVSLTVAQVNPRGESSITLDGGKVSVEYGRPQLKGRDLDAMISPGDEWRMGADQATKLTTTVDLKFGSKVVSKGTYTLRAKLVEADKWHLLIVGDSSLAAEVPMTLVKASESVDLMTINLEGQGSSGKLTLRWGKLSISADFSKA